MKVAKFYLLYFSLVIICTIAGITQGEDTRTLIFMFGLSIIPSTFLYLYNLIITIIGRKYFSGKNDSVFAFLLPILLLVVFQKQFIEQVSELDMGLDKVYWIIVIFSLIINLSGYFYIKKELKN